MNHIERDETHGEAHRPSIVLKNAHEGKCTDEPVKPVLDFLYQSTRRTAGGEQIILLTLF